MLEQAQQQVASRVRRANHTSPLMLVALSGFGQEQHRKRTTQAGFDHHLVKPVDVGALQALLQGAPRPPEVKTPVTAS
jgi:CheY-like chemotaxis protein